MRELNRRLMTLRPMQAGASGYARLQWERGRALIQMNARGVGPQGFRAFWYSGGGEARELGASPGNARGEASLLAEAPFDHYAPERLQALLLIENAPRPRPLLIGLCAEGSAGSLLDAKNASLSLCEKLQRAERREESPGETPGRAPTDGLPREGAPSRKQERPAPLPSRGRGGQTSALPREIFLPALDPAPYVQAVEKPKEAPGERLPAGEAAERAFVPKKGEEKPPRREPAGRLPELQWPKAFGSLRGYFERCLPCAPFELPGWRFVQVSRQGDGLWIGRQADGERVLRVAYAMRGRPPRDDPRPYQTLFGRDGAEYRLLVQRA